MEMLAEILIESIEESGAMACLIAAPLISFAALLLMLQPASITRTVSINERSPGYGNAGCGGGGPGINF